MLGFNILRTRVGILSATLVLIFILSSCAEESSPRDSGFTDAGQVDSGATDAGFDGGVCVGMDGGAPISKIGDTTFKKGPYLMFTDRTSITVKWESTSESDSLVEYGETEALGSKATGEKALVHMVRLTGLKPGTNYFYKAGDGTTMTSVLTAHTAAAPGTPFRFAAYGDSQSHPEIHEQVVRGISDFGPSFVLHAGDEVTDGSVEDEWQTLFFDVTRALAHRVPYYIGIGNHEQQSPLFFNYSYYPPPAGAENPTGYYTFRWGDAFFIVFNSPIFFLGTSDPQYKWGKRQLDTAEARTAKWRIALWHEVAYSEAWGHCDYTGEERFRDTLIPMLEKAGVQMIINGHTHDYQRGVLNGVYHVISGGGGGDLETIHCVTYPWVTVENFVHNYVTAEADCTEMRIRAVDIDGNELDRFTIPANPLE